MGIKLDRIAPSDIDESPLRDEKPRDYALRMGREKARACAAARGFVLAGDTVVAAGRRILPKAEQRNTAQECLQLLSGRRHTVFSSVALLHPDGVLRERVNETTVKFKRLSPQEMDAYLDQGEWLGKAGGYAIQGAAEGLIVSIQGSHSGVVGLPLFETRALLKAAGFPLG